MPINVTCPTCGRTRRVPDEVVGMKARCPGCKTSFRIAAPGAPASAAGPAPGAPAPRSAIDGMVVPPPADPGGYDLALDPEPEPAPAPVPPPAAVAPAPRPARPQPQARPASAPNVPPPDFSEVGASKETAGRPPVWIYGLAGGSAAAVAIAVSVALRAMGGSTPASYPDPSATIALGVASKVGAPAKPPAAPAPALAAVSAPVPAPAPAAVNPTPAAVVADRAPSPTTVPAPPASAPPSPNAAPPPASAPGAPMSTAQIVARWEPSVALVKGAGSSGTGFLVAPGIIATNAHVIDEEFITALEVRFPSAPEGQQGPMPAELLYEDPKRDLAFLKVATNLPAIEVAPSYAFLKGEDITIIGNPGLGEEIVLENAISRGVMSSKAAIEGLNYFQINIAINPGNSGGPVFDSSGRAIGVATLKSTKAEAIAFCIPVDDVRSAMAQLGTPHPEYASRHRSQVAFKMLTVAGALYGIGIDIRGALMRQAKPGTRVNFLPNEPIQKFDELLTTLDQKVFSLMEGEVAQLRNDASLSAGARGRYQDLAATFKSMKTLYGNTNRTAADYTGQVRNLRASFLRQIQTLQKDVKLEVPQPLLAAMKLTVTDGQPQTALAQIAPSPMQSRVLKGRIRQPQTRAGARGNSPAQSAHDRIQERRNQRRGNN